MLGIEVNGIKKLYPNGNIGIESVSFSIRKGTITAYLGPNGAGKTTTLNIFSTLLKPDFGECFIDGLDVVEEGDKVRDAIGYLPEDFGLYRVLTVYQNVKFFAKLRMNDLKYLKEKVEETLELLGLKDRKNEKAYSLSKGLKQRVGLAIAMVHEPEILLLDEPTSGLDPNATKRFLDLLRELNRNSTTILFSTHILSLAEKICDDVVIIDKGKILLTSKIDDAKAKLRSKDLEDVYFSITEGAYESY